MTPEAIYYAQGSKVFLSRMDANEKADRLRLLLSLCGLSFDVRVVKDPPNGWHIVMEVLE